MKSSEELRALYDNELRDNLQALEVKRKAVRNKLIGMALIIFTTIACFALHENEGLGFLLYIGIAGIIAAIVFIAVFSKDKGAYRREFKEKVVRAIVSLINAEWRYEPD